MTPSTPAVTADADAATAPSQEPAAPRFQRRHVVYLLLITLLGALLRLFHLADWSVWIDEAHTWRDITSPLDSFLGSDRAWYPLSFLGLRWLADTTLLPQLSEGWLRLPFAFAGIVSVPLLAVLGHHLVGRRGALLAALFLAINPWHIYFSQNARGYVLMCFFATLAAGLYWLGLQRERRSLRLLGWGAAVLAGASHLTGLALLPVFFVYPRLGHLRGRRAWGWVLGIGAAGLVMPLLLALPPLRSFSAAKPDTSLTHLLHTTAYYFRLPLLCAAATGFWLSFRSHSRGRVLFLACWLAVPLFVVGVLGSSVVKVTARYAFCALPAVMLLAGAASVRLAETLASGLGQGTWRSKLVPAAVLPVILCLDMIAYDYLYFTVQYGDRGRWREAAMFVRDAAGNAPIELYSVNEPSMLYYLRPRHYLAWRRQASGEVASDPHPGCRVWAMTAWEIGRGWSEPVGYEEGPAVEPGEKAKAPPGVEAAHGADSWLHLAQRNAQAHDRALFFVVTLPELAEMDPTGALRAALWRECELRTVLPCSVGPKDETIYVWAYPRR